MAAVIGLAADDAHAAAAMPGGPLGVRPAKARARSLPHARAKTAPRHAAPHTGTAASRAATHGARRFARSAAGAAVTHHKTAKKAVSLERRLPAVRSGLPNVQALGALVVDENGHELYARSPDRERPIASISKLAATLAVMDRGLELEGLSTITRADIEVTRGGARSRLLEGMTLSNRDLLHAALMGSDNRAIPALGRAVKLSPTQLAAAMTAKAKELGLSKTHFHDPTGLSIDNVSTPRETIALLRAVMRNPVLGPITQRVEYDAHPIGKPPIRYFNTYRPAMRNNVQVLGGKTGYNDDARYCLVLAAKIDGRTCFMSFLANEGKLTRFGDVARVADWMINRKPNTPPSGTAVAVIPLPSASAAPRARGPGGVISAAASTLPALSPPAPTPRPLVGPMPPAVPTADDHQTDAAVAPTPATATAEPLTLKPAALPEPVPAAEPRETAAPSSR